MEVGFILRFIVFLGVQCSLWAAGAEINNTSCQPVFPAVSPSQLTNCHSYYFEKSNGYCTEHLHNALIYGSIEYQKKKEAELQRFDSVIKLLLNAGVHARESCFELFIDVACHQAFKACVTTSGNLTQQHICRETCDLGFRMCDKELALAKKINEQQGGSNFPYNLHDLKCKSIYPRDGGTLGRECYYQRALNTETDKMPGTDCYYGNGLGYCGNVSMTRSGITCQSWSSQCPHRHHRTDSAQYPELVNASIFCRNPAGQAPDGPWCYTSNASVRWEYCAVPKCPPSGPSKAPTFIRAFATGPQSIYSEWAPVPLPFVHGEPRGFRLMLRRTGDNFVTTNTTGPSVTSLEFHGLRQSSKYSLEISEFNENGIGPVSPPIFVMTMPKDSVGVRFEMTLKSEVFGPELLDAKTTRYNTLSTAVQDSISSLFKKEASLKFTIYQIKILKFSNGSVTVQFDVTAGFNGSQSTPASVTSALVGIIVMATRTGQLGGRPVSPALLLGPPPAPTKLQATSVGTSSIAVTWSAPDYHAAYRITNYTVHYKKHASEIYTERILSAPQLRMKINGLDSATTYDVRVTSHNTYGKGVSLPISVKTEAEPDIALILGIGIPVILLVVIAVGVLVVLWRWRRQKMKLEEALEREMDRYASSGDVFALLGIESPSEWWEIPRDDLTIERELGSGAFGVVKKASLKIRAKAKGNEDEKIKQGSKDTNKEGQTENDVHAVVECAVKMLKSNPTERELRDLCNEISIMALVGDHPNVVSLIGACTLDGPLWLVVKFAENGCFLDYIKEHRFAAEYENTSDQIPAYQNVPKKTGVEPLTEREKLKFAYEIAKGMAHLEKKRCVHRDLAARNILLGKDNVAMVSDFGLSRDVYESGAYDNTTGGVLPVRWMALESLEDYTYTTQSDVWSYAVLLWEMESGGLMPYAGMSGAEVVVRLKQGHRLENPSQCSEEMYAMMVECWNPEPQLRPTFSTLVTILGKLLLLKAGYEELLPGSDNEGLALCEDAPYNVVQLMDVPDSSSVMDA